MKFTLVFLGIIFISQGFAQIPLEGRWTLQSVKLKDRVYFDREAGPQKPTTAMTVDWQTPDEAFNKRMNQKPYEYFCRSQVNFLDDSVFVRVATAFSNGSYVTEYHYGNIRTQSDTNLLHFDLRQPKVFSHNYNYEIKDSLLILTKKENGQESIYKRQTTEIDNEFNSPWKQDGVPLIIDAYHGNDIDWNLLLTDRKVTGIIHKASQGMTADTLYKERKFMSVSRRYVWGSYHLGTDADPIKQAEFYYEITGGDSTELCCLDLEDVNAKGNMNLKQAEKFIAHWYKLTGRYPMLYCNKNVLSQINKKYGRKSIFAKCPLWYARFRDEIPDWEVGTWDTYTLWQFSSEINCERDEDCLYDVKGVAHDMDVNVYNGGLYELRLKWPNL